MAIGKASDLKVYEPEFYGGVAEAIARQVNVFNAASAGAIRLVPQAHVGNYLKESFFKDVSGLVSRRDTTSVSAATDLALTQDENIAVKLNRKIGPVAQTIDAFRKVGKDMGEISFVLGQMVGERKALEMLDSAVTALVPAIGAVNNVDKSGGSPTTITHGYLVNQLALLGDQASLVRAFLMHSKQYFDLVGQAITDKVTEVAGAVIYSGNVATLGKPTIVTDSAPLFIAGTPNKYACLALVEGAATVIESEAEQIVSEVVTGLENLVIRVQGEYAYSLQLKGFKWDVANGGANPAAAAVGTASNWDQVATSAKHIAGARLLTT